MRNLLFILSILIAQFALGQSAPKLINDIDPGPVGSHTWFIGEAGGKMFFSSVPKSNRRLFAINVGNPDKVTTLLTEAMVERYVLQSPIVFQDKVFFVLYDKQTEQSQLWSSDGSIEGTSMFKDFGRWSTDGKINNLTIHKGKLYFSFEQAKHRPLIPLNVFVTKGTPQTTKLAASDTNYYASRLGYLIGAGDALFFKCFQQGFGNEMFVVSLKKGVIKMIDELSPGGDSSVSAGYHMNAIMYDDQLYFNGSRPGEGPGLYMCDDTKNTPKLVKQFVGMGSIEYLGVANDRMYFLKNMDDGYIQIWVVDSQGQSMYALPDLPKMRLIDHACVFQDEVYFNVYGTSFRKVIGKIDSNDQYSEISVDGAGNTLYNPQYLRASASHLYFRASSEENGVELWKSDGTENGTICVDLAMGEASSIPRDWYIASTGLFVSATIDSYIGLEPYYIAKETFESETSIKLYPNPAKNVLTITWPEDGLKNHKVGLYNACGSLIYDGHYGANVATIDVDHLLAGVYVILVEGVGCQRFVKY